MKKKLLAFAVAFIAMTGLAGTADSLRLNAYAQEASVVQQAEAKAPVLSAKTNGKAVKVTFNAVENAKSYQLYRQALSEADVDALVFSTEEQKTSYTFNDTDDREKTVRGQIYDIAMSVEHVLEAHGFYLDEEQKRIQFDIIVSFDAPDRDAVYKEVVSRVREAYPEYELYCTLDTDFSLSEQEE